MAVTDTQKALIEYSSADIINYLMEDKRIPLDSAMNIFYNSALFEKLQDVETGLYLEGSAYVYEFLKDEIGA
jgi:hypothetical protein